MAGEKYEKYGRPVPPVDPAAEYMTVQETAYVLRCSVGHARRILKKLGIKSKPGRRIMTNQADRAHIYESSRVGAGAGAVRARSSAISRGRERKASASKAAGR
ncbi:DNA-binding protein [Streptomyces sp. NPDC059009]|uniref:DNA-binding protein n=1 Tax=Streptomyces sp. NPDC059009 TaxID=3346694 RepID=UPI0036839076